MAKTLRQEARAIALWLVVPAVLCAAAAAGAAWSGLSGVGALAGQAGHFRTQVFSTAQLSKDLRFDVVQVQQWLTDVSATRGRDGMDDGFEKAKSFVARFGADADRLSGHAQALGDTELGKALADAKLHFAPYYEVGLRMAQAYVAEGPEGGNRLMAEFDGKSEQIQADLGRIDQVVTAILDRAAADEEAIVSANRGRSVLFMVLAALCSAAGIVVALVLGRAIGGTADSLSGAVQVLGRAAHGNLNARITGIRRADEVGRLQHNINRVLDLAEAFGKEAFAAVQSANGRKYYRRILTTGLQGDYVGYAEAINHALKTMEARDAEFIHFADSQVKAVANAVAAASTELEASAGALSAQSSDTTSQAVTVAAAAEQASVNVQAVASAVEEFSASIREISAQVTHAAQVAEAATQAAQRTDATVSGLSEATSRIGDIVNLINDIAAQTNLLALNATIEAARAGDAGKGFAVVAGEVKTLANQTARATDEISAQVAEIQTVTTEAIAAIREISRTVDDIREASAAVAGTVEEQNAVTVEIARNVAEAASGAASVSAAIGTVQITASEADESASQVSAAAAELSQQSETLTREVDSFVARIAAA
jgi:methyl-accepting chemotaxis protein